MNANALAMLKAAAAKKKTGFKEPVVKQVKVTKEQYLQEKAEEEAKKNKKKAFLMGNSGGDDAPHAAAPDPRVTELLGQVNREKQKWAQQMEDIQAQMQQMRSQVAAASTAASSSPATAEATSRSVGGPTVDTELRSDLEKLLERMEALEEENAKLRKQVQVATKAAENAQADATAAKEAAAAAKKAAATALSSSSSAATTMSNGGSGGGDSGISSDEYDDLVDRMETLEEKHSKLTLSVARDSDTLEDTKESVEKLETKVKTLEKTVAAAAKQRSRSVTRKASNTTATEPAKTTTTTTTTTTNNTPVSPTPPAKEAAPAATVPARTPARSNSNSSAPSSMLGPHSAGDVAHAQASDSKLVAALEGKSAGMYPKFSMSVKEVDGLKLVFFYKKLYVPEKLRTKTLQYYYDNHNDDWTRVMAKHVIWPSLDTDVTNFKP